MKNAMKKLLSLVLVAMLLVSVVPMGAMAADETVKDETVNIGLVVNVNGKQEYVAENMTQAPGTTLNQLIDDFGDYGKLDNFAANNGAFGDYETAKNYVVVSGEIYTLNFTKSEEGKPTDPPATEKKTVAMTVKADGQQDVPATFELAHGSAPLSDLLFHHFDRNWQSNYTFAHAYRNGEKITDLNTLIYDGEKVEVRLEKKGATNPSTPANHTVTMKLLFNESQTVSETIPAEIKGESTTIADLLTYKW
ncbi:secreted protein, partial [gut metagenome]